MRWLALALLSLTLAMRIAVPDGTMLVRDAHGAAIVICTIDGPMTVNLPADPSAPSPDHRDDQCAVNAVPGATPLAPPAILPAHAFAYPAPQATTAASDLIPGRGLAAPPPPLRGPPLQL